MVDDVPDLTQSTADLLVFYGYAVRVAECAEKALQLVVAEMPDVILLDIQLPDIDGWTVARRLRATSGRGKQPIIIAVTGYEQQKNREQSCLAGIDLHLVKPVDPAVLVGILNRFSRTLRSTVPCEFDGKLDSHLSQPPSPGQEASNSVER